MKDYDVIVIGGGMVGLAFALEFSQKNNCSIAIVEPGNSNPNVDKNFHSRVSAITPTSKSYLDSLNVWDDISRKRPFIATKVWDQNSHGHLNFHAQDENLEQLGFIVENDLIQSALFGAIDQSKIDFISAKLSNLLKMKNGYELLLGDKDKLTCKLLVGADGSRSKVRQVCEIEISENDYEQKAIIANITIEKSFEDTIWQRFLSDSIVALLPLSDNQASIVWSCENKLAEKLITLEDAEFEKALAEAVEYRFGVFLLQNQRQSFPLIERSSKSYVLPSLALIGDAAHNIHPLAGQGVNLGFADCRELNLQLSSYPDKTLGDYSVLRSYARARRLDNELMAKTMTGLNWIYKENIEPVRWLRGIGMNIIDDTPMLKSFFQRHALGKPN